MKIIQSFAQFDEGNPYAGHVDKNLNFYSFLLSFLLLKKRYGRVTMVCNKAARHGFIDFIPYDEIVLKECSYVFDLWGAYKIDSYRAISGDIIHVDPDVFIFDDLLGKFIKSSRYDIIVQNMLPAIDFKHGEKYILENINFFTRNNIINLSNYDYRFTSCGVIGFRKKAKQLYLANIDKIESGMRSGEVGLMPVNLFEELTVYFTATVHDLKICDILPYDLVCKHGVEHTGNLVNYTHLWKGTKFEADNIRRIKNRINKEFPSKYSLVEDFEKNVLV